MTPKTTPSSPDWPAIEYELRVARFSINEMSRRFGPSATAIRKYRDRHGIKPDLAQAVRAQTADKLVRAALPNPDASDAQIVEAAAEQAIAVIQLHRRDIAALRQQAAELLAQLQTDGLQPVLTRDGLQQLPMNLKDKTEILRNLAQATARYMPLERQAWNMDASDGGAVTVEDMSNEQLLAIAGASGEGAVTPPPSRRKAD